MPQHDPTQLLSIGKKDCTADAALQQPIIGEVSSEKNRGSTFNFYLKWISMPLMTCLPALLTP